MARKSMMPQRIEKAKENIFIEDGKPSILHAIEEKFGITIKDFSVFRDKLKSASKEYERLDWLKFGEANGFVPPPDKNYNTAGKKEVNQYFEKLVEDYFKNNTPKKGARQEVIDSKKKVEPRPDPQIDEEKVLIDILDKIRNISEGLSEIKKDIKDIQEKIDVPHEHETIIETSEPDPEPKYISEEDKLDKKYRQRITEMSPGMVEELRHLLREEMEHEANRENMVKLISELMDLEEEDIKVDFKNLSNKSIMKIFFREAHI